MFSETSSLAAPALEPEASRMQDIMAGLRMALPIMLGYLPLGFAFGVLAGKNGIVGMSATIMSIMVFAGSGQFVAASLWGAGVPIPSVIMTTFVVNLRYMLMSAALSPHVRPLKKWQQSLIGFQLTDETFAVQSDWFNKGGQARPVRLISLTMFSHSAWIGGTALGVFLGTFVADVRPFGLDYALIAMFLALLVPQCHDRLRTLIALGTGLMSVMLFLAGAESWNVILATLVGASAGAFLEVRRERNGGTSDC